MTHCFSMDKFNYKLQSNWFFHGILLSKYLKSLVDYKVITMLQGQSNNCAHEHKFSSIFERGSFPAGNIKLSFIETGDCWPRQLRDPLGYFDKCPGIFNFHLDGQGCEEQPFPVWPCVPAGVLTQAAFHPRSAMCTVGNYTTSSLFLLNPNQIHKLGFLPGL